MMEKLFQGDRPVFRPNLVGQFPKLSAMVVYQRGLLCATRAAAAAREWTTFPFAILKAPTACRLRNPRPWAAHAGAARLDTTPGCAAA